MPIRQTFPRTHEMTFFNVITRDRIAHLPGVAATCMILVDLMSVENAELMIVSGREWGCFAWENLKLVSGRMPKDQMERAVLLGTTAADVLKKKVGDTVQIETEELTVVGIVEGGAFVENGSIILSLPLLQQITGNQDKISAIDVRDVTAYSGSPCRARGRTPGPHRGLPRD